MLKREVKSNELDSNNYNSDYLCNNRHFINMWKG